MVRRPRHSGQLPKQDSGVPSSTPPKDQAIPGKVVITLVDENGLAVPSAQVMVTNTTTGEVIKGETDYLGRREFPAVKAGWYRITISRLGFYEADLDSMQIGAGLNLQLTLDHEKEFSEHMDVVYSPDAIDPSKSAHTQELDSQQVVNLPYARSRDIRNILPLLPSVTQDPSGQVHLNGSDTKQIQDRLDGFNITDPVTGQLNLRFSADAVRSVEVMSSRYSTEYGKGSGGVVSFGTGIGDDRFRFSATDFFPTIQDRKGVSINNWTPRASVSGPIRKGRVWFFDSADGEYKVNIVDNLPSGADRNPFWRASNLSKVQANLTQTNILSASFLINESRSEHDGLSEFDPVEATPDIKSSAHLFTIRDQASFTNGVVLDGGFAISRFNVAERPLGNAPFSVSPDGNSGNFFRSTISRADRNQGLANVALPPIKWLGTHNLKAGVDIEWIAYRQFFNRNEISVLRENDTVSRQVKFFGNDRLGRADLLAGGFVQDRWALSDRLIIEAGARMDRDQILSEWLISPRVAASYALTRDRNTKLSGGVGIYYDTTNLDLVTRPLAGPRIDTFFNAKGHVFETVETRFLVDEDTLKEPRFLNWSAGLERKLPFQIYADVEYVQKRGSDGFAYNNTAAGFLSLENNRRDRYHSLEITARRSFRNGYQLFASYTRSAAHSNEVLDFSLDNLVFGPQSGGPVSWDTPNRFLTWGWLPLPKHFDLAYSLEWRDGFPFSLVDQDQQIVGAPNSSRFPNYFSLNTHIERRFNILGAQWAIRAGVNNLTDRDNPAAVNNNIDSPMFLTFGGLQRRVFTARIRFLGRK